MSLVNHIAQWLSFLCFVSAGFIHISFFVYESIILQRPQGKDILKVNDQVYLSLKPWIFNQGIYNLCLSLGTFIGLSFIFQKQIMLAGVLTGFCGFSMIGAGIALWWSVKSLRKIAYLQMLPPILGFFFLFFHVMSFVLG